MLNLVNILIFPFDAVVLNFRQNFVYDLYGNGIEKIPIFFDRKLLKIPYFSRL
jgi:hypothetical protein